jgi:hypothetical protein
VNPHACPLLVEEQSSSSRMMLPRPHERIRPQSPLNRTPPLIPAPSPVLYPRSHPTAFGREQARAGILFAERERNGVPAGSVSLGDRCRRGSENPVQPVLRCAQGGGTDASKRGPTPVVRGEAGASHQSLSNQSQACRPYPLPRLAPDSATGAGAFACRSDPPPLDGEG